MILSNIAIQDAIDRGLITILPDPQPRQPSASSLSPCPYNTTSVDLRLGPTISCPMPGSYTFDLRRPGIATFLARNCTHTQFDPTGGYALQPGQFILGSTLERIELPIISGRPVFAARIEGKISFARCGLLVHFTAPTVHAGWSGPLTLEMKNLGANPVMLYPEMPICQLILEEVSGFPIPNPSQFHGQASPAGTRSAP